MKKTVILFVMMLTCLVVSAQKRTTRRTGTSKVTTTTAVKKNTTTVICTTCNGSGKIACPACGGQGYTDVQDEWGGNDCRGCKRCGGNGQLCRDNPYYKAGKGKVKCSGCKGTGKLVVAVETNNDVSGHGYVDLGLSVKWATCNVGADKPEDYGMYFAWGDTKGYSLNTNDGHSFDWGNYRWCSGSDKSMTKYCSGSSMGTVDMKAILDVEDDAAHVCWGGSWRMPTKEEQMELLKKCIWTWTTLNGVDGYRVSGSNGNCIFIPAAGYRNGHDTYDVGKEGVYWSSSLDTRYSSHASSIELSIGYKDLLSCVRNNGMPVRPVCP